MTCKFSSKVSFTAIPNRYLDQISPKLSEVERAIVLLLMRMTIGWHQDAVRLSTEYIVNKTGKSRRAVQLARKQLIKIGLVKILEEARGTRAALYSLDLYYDTKKDNEQIQHELQQTLPLLDNEHDEDVTFDTTFNPTSEPFANYIPDVTNQNIQLPDDEPTLHTDISEDIDSIEDAHQVSEIVDSEETVLDSVTLPPTTPQPVDDNHDSGHSNTPANIQNQRHTKGELNAPLAYSSTISNIYYNINKHTEEQNGEEKRKNPKKAVASVRFYFLSTFPETKAEDDWKFFGWAIKEYGLEACMYQLNYMKEHRKKHPIANPKGFFKCSLEKNYQIPAFMTAKIKADERADFAIEHGNKLRKEREQWQKEAVDFNTGQDAIKNIIAMLGQTE